MATRYTKNNAMLPVDGEKFKAQFVKRGLNMAEVSIELGHSRSFLNGICGTSNRAAKISKSASIFLDKLYNIKYEDYAPDGVKSKSAVPAEKEQDSPSIDYDRLYKVVYNAVYNALDRIFNDTAKKDADKKEGAK